MSILSLPAKIRLQIFDQVFRTVTVRIERFIHEDDRGIVSCPRETPVAVLRLKLAHRTFAKEIANE